MCERFVNIKDIYCSALKITKKRDLVQKAVQMAREKANGKQCRRAVGKMPFRRGGA